MCHNKSLGMLLVLASFLNQFVAAQKAASLPVSTPEKQGVSSAAISKFLDAANNSKTEFHSFMMLRHGKVVAKG